MIKHLPITLLTILQLTACATATRGTTTLLVVNSSPSGARVSSNIETKYSKKTGTLKRKTAQEKGTASELKFEYIGCNPTPCGFEVPRKARFEILVSKDAYVPQLYFIDRIHRKDVAKQNSKKIVVTAGVAAGAGAVTAVATGAVIAGTSLAAPFAMLAAFPVAVAGGTSILVDAASGANFDLTPNPVMAKMRTIEESVDSKADIDLVVSEFYKRRRNRAFGFKEETLEKKKIKMCSVSHTERVPCETISKK